MTQEHKELLLKDLCSRLPYGVVCADMYTDEKFINKWNILAIDGTYGNEFVQVCISNCEKIYGYKTSITNIKPYLFPLSSMTEEQKVIYGDLCYDVIHSLAWDMQAKLNELVDWCNKNHLDWRGLIPMGLANDATNLNVY
jgi:hypothetical protein